MTVYLRYLAFSNRHPRSFMPFSLTDGSTAGDLLRAILRNWVETGTGTEEEQDSLTNHALLASNGRVLSPEESLEEGQNISVIGPILGG